jgi:hypothetical protein
MACCSSRQRGHLHRSETTSPACLRRHAAEQRQFACDADPSWPAGKLVRRCGLDQLPAGQIRQAPCFSSERPAHRHPSARQDRDSGTDATPDEEGISESTGSRIRVPVSPGFQRGPPPGPRRPGLAFGLAGWRCARRTCGANGHPFSFAERADLPRLEGSPVRPCFADFTMPDNTRDGRRLADPVARSTARTTRMAAAKLTPWSRPARGDQETTGLPCRAACGHDRGRDGRLDGRRVGGRRPRTAPSGDRG